LRELLTRHAGNFNVSHDTGARYSLEAPIGPATIGAWGGKIRKRTIPVAWVQMGTATVSYHLTGIPGNSKLLSSLSVDLRARMQGKSCFNFNRIDPKLFRELQRVTTESLREMKEAEYISEGPGSDFSESRRR
jgi:hypothetical protein